MNRSVKLIGLDFGTTTSSAVVGSAELLHNAVTGRTELARFAESYRSEMSFTPLHGDSLDLHRLTLLIDGWLDQAGVRGDELFGGGAILTGLTAERTNAPGLVAILRQRVGEAVLAIAQDPCFESWLAFMGSCAAISRELGDRPLVNLDIGGGTTNLALGTHGEVLRTGCLAVGARHVEVVPGTYRIVRLSKLAEELFHYLSIAKGPGDPLDRAEVDSIVRFYVGLLGAALSGNSAVFEQPIAQRHLRAPLAVHGVSDPIVTLSGGVAELVYAYLRTGEWPSPTAYGDLGIDLARGLVAVPAWLDHFRRWSPPGGGRATVYGLLRHSTQVSGNTVFLPDPSVLPLRNVPIFGHISVDTADGDLCERLALAAHVPGGAALAVRLPPADHCQLQRFSERLRAALQRVGFPNCQTLVLLTNQNVALALGNCVTDWGRLGMNLIAVDEVDVRGAQFVQIGRMQHQVVPVSFFGVGA